MAHEISVTLRSDPSPYEAAIKRMSKATSEWELSTAAGADDVDEKFADVIRALVEMGGAFDAAALQGRIRDIVNDTDKWAQANLISQQTGLDLGTVLSGMAGNAEDAALASQAFADVWDKIPGSVDTKVMYDAKASLEGVTSALDGAPAKIDAVSAAMERQASQLYDAALASGEATGKIDELGNAIYRMPDGKEVVVNAQTQKAYEDLNALEQKPIPNKQFTVKALIDDSEVQAWRAPMKVGYVEMRPKAGGMLSGIWD